MQHAWLLALLALPAARAVACECDEWRNGATAEDPALCRKLEGGVERRESGHRALRPEHRQPSHPARAEEESAAAAAGGAVERAAERSAGEAERQAEDGRQQQEARGAPRQPGVEQGLELKM